MLSREGQVAERGGGSGRGCGGVVAVADGGGGLASVLCGDGGGVGGVEAVGAVGVNGPGGAGGAEGGEGGGVVVRHGPSLRPAHTPVKSRRKVRGAEHKSATAVVAGAQGSGGQPTRAGDRK